jgi:hypothetical protein
MDGSIVNAKQAGTSSSSSSSSTPAPTEGVKKFKLDPMSLLLPHERQMYAASQPTSFPQSNFGQLQPQPQQMAHGHGYQAQTSGANQGAQTAQGFGQPSRCQFPSGVSAPAQVKADIQHNHTKPINPVLMPLPRLIPRILPHLTPKHGPHPVGLLTIIPHNYHNNRP